MRFVSLFLALAAFCLGGAFLSAPSQATDSTTWLCKPGQADNPCAGPVDGSVLAPDGGSSGNIELPTVKKPKVDCFYVYPTQSSQPGKNANLDKDPAIRRAVVQQARQFSRVCRVFAPMYRQYTLSNLLGTSDESRDLAYGDVVNAWNDYLTNYNHGRGVILIGHSQGSSHLERMIAEHIDQKPNLRKRIVSAIIPGANAWVPKGKLVGGLFQNMPACSKVAQTGCIVAWSTFDQEPPAFSFFGRTTGGYYTIPGGHPDPARYDVICVNPATLDGSNGAMLPLLNTAYAATVPATASEPAAPWIEVPDYYTSECRNVNGASWLNVTKVASADDQRPNLTATSQLGHNLHTFDMTLSEGNLVRMAAIQARAYEANGDLQKDIKILQRKTAALKKARAGCARAKKADRSPRAVKKACRPVRTLQLVVEVHRSLVHADRAFIKWLKSGDVPGL